MSKEIQLALEKILSELAININETTDFNRQMLQSIIKEGGDLSPVVVMTRISRFRQMVEVYGVAKIHNQLFPGNARIEESEKDAKRLIDGMYNSLYQMINFMYG